MMMNPRGLASSGESKDMPIWKQNVLYAKCLDWLVDNICKEKSYHQISLTVFILYSDDCVHLNVLQYILGWMDSFLPWSLICHGSKKWRKWHPILEGFDQFWVFWNLVAAVFVKKMLYQTNCVKSLHWCASTIYIFISFSLIKILYKHESKPFSAFVYHFSIIYIYKQKLLHIALLPTTRIDNL